MKTTEVSDKAVLKGAVSVIAAAALLGAGFWAWLFLAHPAAGSGLPDYGEAVDFRMAEKGGGELSLADLRGRVWIADFIFTRCGGQCPLMTQTMKRLAADLPAVRFVSFTSDPDYDTPEILARYAEDQGAVSDRWYFARGTKEELGRVTRGFSMGAIGEPFMHSTRFVLIDRNGRIRGLYDSGETGKVGELKRDASLLVRSRAA